MVKVPLKRSRFSFRIIPGKAEPSLPGKLSIPGIDITRFRTYQHRAKGWRVEGYNPSRNTENEQTSKRREYRLNINGFKAWKIGFMNNHQVPVDITMHFTIHGKYGLVYDYSQTCSNILPGKEAELSVIPWLKTAGVRLDSIDVYTGSVLLSSTEVNSLMPFRKGSFALSFFIACFIGVNFLFISSNNKQIPVNNNPTTWVSMLAFYLAFWEAFNITPVIFMFFLLVIAPFYLHDPIYIAGILVLGCFYLWAVWIKRSSIKDSLMGAFIP